MAATRVESSVVKVTVYRNGARVVRAAAVKAESGTFPPEIVFHGLPLCLDDSSVRVRLECPGGGPGPRAREIKIGIEAPPRESVPPPRDEELEAARVEEARLRSEVRRIERLIKSLGKLKIEPRPAPKKGGRPGPLPAEARLALLEFRRKRLESATLDLRSKSALLEKANGRLAELEFRKRTSSTAEAPRENELRKSVTVRLSGSASQGTAEARVEYLVPGAAWAPSYTIGFDRAFSSAAVAMRASVCQRTGEDWKSVELLLSTAEPGAWAGLPKLPALKIGRVQAAKAQAGWREPPQGLSALFAEYDSAAREASLPSAPAGAAAPIPALPEDEEFEDEETEEDVFFEESEENLVGAEPAMECCADVSEGVVDDMSRRDKEKFAAPSAKKGAPAMYMQGPPPAPCASAPAQRQSAMAPPAAGRGARVRSEPAPAVPAQPSARDDMLAYGALAMAGPGEPNRGKLRVLPAGSLHGEFRGAAGMDVSGAIARAASEARSAAESRLPAGLEAPDSRDGFDYSYSCDAPADVPSDGMYHTVRVAEFAASSAMTYVTVPRESAEAFRFAEIPNPTGAPLLRGPADVLAGGEFLMTVPMALTAPGGGMDLWLGAEQGIKVARNASFSEHSGGLLGGKLGLLHRIEIEISNALPAAAEVEVRERIPVPREGDKEIEIESGESKPPWEKFVQKENAVRGSCRWRVKIMPGGREKLTASYTIRISSKKEIAGGNRRES